MFKRLVLLVVVLLILSGSTLYAADAPEMQWHKGLGTDTEEKCQHVMQTSDGGYIACIDTDTAPGPRPNNFGLMKISPDKSAGFEIGFVLALFFHSP